MKSVLSKAWKIFTESSSSLSVLRPVNYQVDLQGHKEDSEMDRKVNAYVCAASQPERRRRIE